MESVQQQLTVVSRKVDALQELVEQLNAKLSAALPSDITPPDRQMTIDPGISSYSSYRATAINHKDILADSSHPELGDPSGDKVLTPELQIQRLTAQLTAAYNRIAVLEEQLLSQRIH